MISINAFNDQTNALTLNSTHQNINCSPLLRVVHEAVRQQTETGYPQAIILRYFTFAPQLAPNILLTCIDFSGSNGSGKTYSSMVILRQLFNVVGGGPETDSFKHLAAAFTVLRSLGSAKTINKSESSRIVRRACGLSVPHNLQCSSFSYLPGQLHRGSSNGRSNLPHQDSLLLFGSGEGHCSVS